MKFSVPSRRTTQSADSCFRTIYHTICITKVRWQTAPINNTLHSHWSFTRNVFDRIHFFGRTKDVCRGCCLQHKFRVSNVNFMARMMRLNHQIITDCVVSSSAVANWWDTVQFEAEKNKCIAKVKDKNMSSVWEIYCFMFFLGIILIVKTAKFKMTQQKRGFLGSYKWGKTMVHRYMEDITCPRVDTNFIFKCLMTKIL